MSNPSMRKSPAVRTATRSLPNSNLAHWNPLPHDDDSTIRVFDFAYATGVAPPTSFEKLVAAIKTTVVGLLAEPVLLRTLLLIFGGCCSNVYTLESILTLSSSTGTLITLLQFIFIALYTLPSQLTFDVTSPPEPPPLKPTQTVWLPRLKRRRVPLQQWCIFAAQFVLINILNNAAFDYKISLPLHIILRSAGPVASMAVGYIWKGRSYSRRKVFSVLLLFAGVVLAALSDASSKGPVKSAVKAKKEQEEIFESNATITTSRPVPTEEAEVSTLTQQAPGFVFLTLALLLSSIMGIWSDTLYNRYGRNSAIASEQLFYGHLLSLPFFTLYSRTLYTQFTNLLAMTSGSSSTSTSIPDSIPTNISPTTNLLHQLAAQDSATRKMIPRIHLVISRLLTNIPRPLILLFLNSTTQIACISGVHHLSTQTSALTVSIVLNVRKVISLLLSIWLFGNNLPAGVLVGAAIVFLGGGIYGLPDGKASPRKPDMKRAEEAERRRLGIGNVNGESKKDR